MGIIVAPLLLAPAALHGLLLVLPMPSGFTDLQKAAPEKAEPEKDGPVDLLSLSVLTQESPSVVAELPLEETPAHVSISEPQSSTQPVVLETNPEIPPEEQPQSPSPSPDDRPLAFDPARQQTVMESALNALSYKADGSTNNFDQTDSFPENFYPLYIVGNHSTYNWPDYKQTCFFDAISETSFQLRSGAFKLRYFLRNVDRVEQDDLPRTFPDQESQALSDGYCNEALYQITENGQPLVWVSLVAASPGGSTTLVIFWSQDPRMSG